MSNTAPSRADPVVVFPLGRWCPPQETSQPHPPPPHRRTLKLISIPKGRLWVHYVFNGQNILFLNTLCLFSNGASHPAVISGSSIMVPYHLGHNTATQLKTMCHCMKFMSIQFSKELQWLIKLIGCQQSTSPVASLSNAFNGTMCYPRGTIVIAEHRQHYLTHSNTRGTFDFTLCI